MLKLLSISLLLGWISLFTAKYYETTAPRIVASSVELQEEILAIVLDTPIYRSAMKALQASAARANSLDEKEVFKELLLRNLLLACAKQELARPTPAFQLPVERIEELVLQKLTELIKTAGSQAQLEAAFGQSTEKIKALLTQQVTGQALSQLMYSHVTQLAQYPSPAGVKRFYETLYKSGERLPIVPWQVEVVQFIFIPFKRYRSQLVAIERACNRYIAQLKGLTKPDQLLLLLRKKTNKKGRWRTGYLMKKGHTRLIADQLTEKDLPATMLQKYPDRYKAGTWGHVHLHNAPAGTLRLLYLAKVIPMHQLKYPQDFEAICDLYVKHLQQQQLKEFIKKNKKNVQIYCPAYASVLREL